MRKLTLLSAAWFGDRAVEIAFPSAWDVTVVGRKDVPALSPGEMGKRLRRPIGTPPLSELARGKRRAAIIIDDMTRPTPTAEILPLLLDELKSAGLGRDAVTVVIASGAHHVPTRDEIERKVGETLIGKVGIVTHNSDADAVPLGKTEAGTPVLVNRAAMECDLKIGVGGIYPHRCAGYSGGAKIVAPGICGTETIRHLHDYFPGGGSEGGSLGNRMRLEMEAIAGMAGLDFIVDVLLNQERRIAGLFAGDKTRAFREGAAAADVLYGVTPPLDADIVVSNSYPFDTALGYINRGFWPFAGAGRGVTKVVVGASPMGRGYHRLGPFDRSLRERIGRRIRDFRPADRRHWHAGMRILRNVFARRRHDFLFWCPGLTREELLATYRNAVYSDTWDGILEELVRRHPGDCVRVAVYPCAPLQTPVPERGVT